MIASKIYPSIFRAFNFIRPFSTICSTTNTELHRSSLHEFHLRNNAKMFNFCGWSMPLLYSSPLNEHQSVRSFFGLFDVTHMKQVILKGDNVVELLDHATLGNIREMKPGACLYSVMLNDDAGIIDDLVITRDSEDSFYVVLNCSQANEDITHLRTMIDQFNWNVTLEPLNMTLLAIQGPMSMECLQRGFDLKLDKLNFMNSIFPVKAFGVPNCRISRVGYTGEDGFELMVPNDCAEFVATQILNFSKGGSKGLLSGLSARDSLRIEAGLCLYGNELNKSINIRDAYLLWVLSKKKVSEGYFKGYEKMKEVLVSQNKSARVGLISDTRTPQMRAGTKIFDMNGTQIGHVTSSCVGVQVKGNLAMAYVNFQSRNESLVQFNVRGSYYEAKITKLPFIRTKYYR